MAEIKAFKALRFTPKAGQISELACPPYDIISEEQRKAYLEKNEHNVIRLELPREGQDPYARAGAVLLQWEADGIVATEDEDALYIYEEEFTARGKRSSIRGFVCRVKLEEFSKEIVLPHEETLSKAKKDRFQLMDATMCNFSQIYSLYMDETGTTRGRIEALSSGKPDIEFADGEGVIQRLWIIKDKDAIQAVCGDFTDRKLYIADGHHRYETALNFRDSLRERGLAKDGDAADYVMMMLVDMENPGLVVFPTHRLVRDLAQFDKDAIIKACGEYFDVTPKTGISAMEDELETLYDKGEKAFGFYCGGDEWTQLVLKDKAIMESMLPDKSEALRNLDVSVLHTLVLEKLMGIDKENMAKQINLTYTKIFDEAVEGVQKGEFQCAFILNPTRVEEIRDVAGAGEKMPQKSTYFYPKIITGLVMNKLVDK